MAENGLGDGVRPRIAPLAIGDSGEEDEDLPSGRRGQGNTGGGQTPTLPPIAGAS
jgi:hypothetical protein